MTLEADEAQVKQIAVSKVPLVVSVAAFVWIFRFVDGLVGPWYEGWTGRALPGGMGGAINLVPAKPTEAPEAYINSEIGINGQRKLEGVVSGALVPADARLPGTARWQSTLQASYAFEGPAASAGRFVATHSIIGPRVFDIEARSRGAGYSVLDLRLAFAKGPWEVSATVGNVFDSRGVGGAAVIYRPRLVSYTDYYVVKPRQLMLQLRHDY